jgi:hypothetical protein
MIDAVRGIKCGIFLPIFSVNDLDLFEEEVMQFRRRLQEIKICPLPQPLLDFIADYETNSANTALLQYLTQM